MRKQDIIITTPKHSTIYAYGTAPESYDSPWGDHDHYQTKQYLPAYVLEIKGNLATILVSDTHPESKRQGYGEKPADFLTASEYTLADWVERHNYMRENSHWSSFEEREVYEKGLAKFKSLPHRWRVLTVRTVDIRMVWTEYVERHEVKIKERAALRLQEKLVKDVEQRERRKVLVRLAKAKVGFKKTQVDKFVRNGYTNDNEVRISVDALNTLLDSYEAKS